MVYSPGCAYATVVRGEDAGKAVQKGCDVIRAWGWGVSDGQERFELCTSFCQPGLRGAGPGEFGEGELLSSPTTVATDSSGHVFAADDANSRIEEFTSGGSFIRAWGWGVADGQARFEVCTSTCKNGIGGFGAGQLSEPEGLATDSAGDVFVGEYGSNRVSEFSPTGSFIRAWGWGVSDGQNQFEICASSCQQGLGGGGAGQLYGPVGVATDTSGNVFVADYGNGRIDEFTTSGAFERAWGWGVSDDKAELEICTTSCMRAPFTSGGAGQLEYPAGVAVDAAGDLFVAEGDRISEFATTGSFIRAWGWGVVDGAERLEVCTSSCRQALYGEGAGEFLDDLGVTTDRSGDVFVSDGERSGTPYGRISEFTSSGAFVQAWGWGVSDGQKRFEVCTASCHRSVGGGGAGQLSYPGGLATNVWGNVLVADLGNGRVDEFGTEAAPTQANGAPSVVTGGSSNVTSTAVTLNGSVIPGEDALKSCYFEYGESVNVYGSTVLCAQTVGAGASPVSVSASLTGLTPGTTYHVRLVVTSSAGTGYGSDVSFATTGTFTPTVQTGYAYGGWPSSATLTGGIDPHGNDVTYEFRYGAFSFPTVSSYGEILTGYWGSVAGSGALSGTTSQEVSANIGGLAADTPYYVRLVVFYDGLVTWGPEVRLEITPPEPQATEAPYLQVNGTDAAKGYRVRCQPGNWSYTNYNFETQWVYVAQNGGTSPARSGAGSGNEYQVDQSDIGHPLACLVTPYKLDGRLPSGPGNTTLQSDLLLPEGTGLLVIPSWLKTAWNVISTAHDVPSAWDAGVWCGAAVLVPEIFAVECLTNVTELVLSNALQDALGSVVDPPEANYQSVALPHPLVERERGKRPCPSNLKAGACGVLVRLANRYSGATARATGIIEAIAISRNRTLIARKKRDSETLVVQEAARKVYFGMLTIAIDEQRKAGALFAEGLHRLHADVRIPGARLRALPRHRGTAWERSLQRRMLTHGFDKASIRKAFTARPTSIRGFDLVRSLAIPAPPPAFTRYYDMLEINDVMTLVTELARQHALRSSSEPQLLIDLDKARAACTQTARSAAMQRFLQDTRLNLQPQFYSVLSTATQPLIDGSSKVNPYPRCLG